MREIKFRAWDKREQKWYDKIIEWIFDRPKNSIGQLPQIPDGLVLMQYTGLKDKNGKEIYEGDIVRWTIGKHYWEAVISTVKNNKSNTLYAIETFNNVSSDEEKNIYTYVRNNDRNGARNEIEFLDKSMEIIGNIWENGDLLNDSK